MAKSTGVDATALGKAWGLFWAGLVVFVGISSRFGWGERWQALFEDLYPGYDQGVTGIATGGVLAFLDGFFDAYVVGRLYNRFSASS